MDDVLDIIKSDRLVSEASIIGIGDVVVQNWVREECRDCPYEGRSWSCPPGVGSLEETAKAMSGFSRAAFVEFRTARDRAGLEDSVLSIEAGLRDAGYGKAMGFFVSPCTACERCSYPEKCRKPGRNRPTGESWGIDLLETSRRAGLTVSMAKKGEDFRPVTVFLID